MHRPVLHRLRRSDAVVALALAALAAGVYAPAFRFDFVNYDDPQYASHNPNVTGGPTADNLWWAVTTIFAANWHPLTWISLQFDAMLWGKNAGGFHLTNVLLHAANTALVYLVFQTATGATRRAAVLAALWGLHPLHVESVAWVTERKDVLCAFFWLLAMWLYTRYTVMPSWGQFLPVAACLALALMAKPMAVTLPFALLLFDAWPLGRLRSRADLENLIWEKGLLFVLVAGSCAITFYAQSFGGTVRGFNEIDLGSRFANVVRTYAVYLEQTVWPAGLSPFYPLAPDAIPIWQTAGRALALLCATGLVAAFRQRAPYCAVGWLWFLGTLVPVVGVVHAGEQAHADRYTYLPHIGLFAALVWAGADLAGRLRVPTLARWAVAALLVATLAVVTRQQLSHWRDARALWTRAVAVAPHDLYARVALGKAHFAAGDHDAAMQCFDDVLCIDPGHFEATRMQMVILHESGRLRTPE